MWRVELESLRMATVVAWMRRLGESLPPSIYGADTRMSRAFIGARPGTPHLLGTRGIASGWVVAAATSNVKSLIMVGPTPAGWILHLQVRND